MDLKDFIKGTITAISESITELNDELGDKITVSPDNAKWFPGTAPKDGIYFAHRNINGKKEERKILDVEFNLSVTEAETNEKDGGIKIKVVDAGVNSKKEKENLNTVKFSIPVAFF